MNFFSRLILLRTFGIDRHVLLRLLYKPIINIIKQRKIFYSFGSLTNSLALNYLKCKMLRKKMCVESTPTIPYFLNKTLKKYMEIIKIISFEELIYNQRKYFSFRLIYVCKNI